MMAGLPRFLIEDEAIRGQLSGRLAIRYPAPVGTFPGQVIDMYPLRGKNGPHIMLKWHLVHDHRLRAVEMFDMREGEPRQRSLRRVVRLLTACWKPHWRPKDAKELIGLECRIDVRHFQGWSKGTKLVPLVVGHHLGLSMDYQVADEEDP